ncbi:MAG TPA: amidohydrolase family protein [Solirubrobacterales bacterium]|nr:amidohydrolase family protein [Solirubrobacterales bacterium]
MIDDIFIFDGVVHVIDWSLAFEKSPGEDPSAGETEREKAINLAQRVTGNVFDFSPMLQGEPPDAMKGSPAANYEVIFGQSPTDMAMVGSLPVEPTAGDVDPSIRLNHAFASAYPERCLFTGGVQPHGQPLSAALESMEYQVKELNAQSMKFYPFHWHCDDEEVAYPLYEKCRELGIDVLQFHLCLPADSSHNVEMQRPNGLQNPARDFPDLTFVMHHPTALYFDETVSIVQRFPNIHLLVSPLVQMALIKPRPVLKMFGELLQQVGSRKLIYGSEGAMGGNPTKYIEAVLDLEMPDDLREGYGYPEVTREDKENILGLNMARLFDVDVEARLAEIERSR